MKRILRRFDSAAFRAAFRASLPVMAGYIVLGIAFGVLLESKGYSFLWAALMSLTIYGGSLQFVCVDLLSAGASLISTALISLLVQARHLFYGMSMLGRYRGMGKAKPYLIFSLTDETFALAVNGPPDGIRAKPYYLFVSLLDQCYWLAGSVLGGLAGSLFDFNSAGIDFSMTALFIVIFTDQCMKTKDFFPAALGVSASVLSLLVFGKDAFLIPAMAVITAGLCIYGKARGWKEQDA